MDLGAPIDVLWFGLSKHAGDPEGQGITASEMRYCHWVEPRLVCHVKFSELTRDERLRQPVFLGLREDKEAKDVMLEKP